MISPEAFVKFGTAANPALPTVLKSAGCAMLTHSALGLYEVTLDQPINSAECAHGACVDGGASDAKIHVTHTSDTVKTIRTTLAGVASDAVAGSVRFFRVPAGH